jgi:low temperature requirement protein LtrA
MHSGIFSIVHAVVLLTVSFFVLLAARKADLQNLKTFGYAIAVLLWVSAALVLGKGFTDRHFRMHRMHMMGEKMEHSMMPGQVQLPMNN